MIWVSVAFLVRGATLNLRPVGEPWKGDPCGHRSTVVVTAVAYIDNTSAEGPALVESRSLRRPASNNARADGLTVAKPLAGASGVRGK